MNRPAHIIALAWAAVMIAIVSSSLTLAITGRDGGERHWVSPEEYALIQRYERLDEVRETLMNRYYQPLEEDTLITGALRGMASAVGDVYTLYYTPEEMARESASDEGRYPGIGVLVERSRGGMIEVVRVYPGGPAEAAGLRHGDFIVSVDGQAVDALTAAHYRDGVALIRGELNSWVELGIRRDDALMTFQVQRSDVNISYVDYTMLEGDIGYLAISQFTGDAAERFADAIQYFKDSGAAGLVIDLRNNPGGYLNYVIDMADALLPECVIVYTEDREGERVYHRSDADFYDIPLTVLVNGMSASSSEILAASVQALDRGKVVGVTTYGKGVVQTLTRFREDGAGLQYTTSCYFDAKGRSINGVGVVPDLEIPLDDRFAPYEPDPVSDSQLAAALRVLRAEIGG